MSNIELGWEHELYRRVLEHMGQHLRVTMFDKRGIGLSDRFHERPTIEQRVGDIVAVMDAVDLERCSLVGLSEGGIMAQLFAAQYPSRVGHDRIAHREIDEHGGRLVKSTGDGLLAVFDTPSHAVGCARTLRAELAAVDLTIRAGLHAGEIEVHEDGDVSGLAIILAARVERAAPDGELYASSTVAATC